MNLCKEEVTKYNSCTHVDGVAVYEEENQGKILQTN